MSNPILAASGNVARGPVQDWNALRGVSLSKCPEWGALGSDFVFEVREMWTCGICPVCVLCKLRSTAESQELDRELYG